MNKQGITEGSFPIQDVMVACGVVMQGKTARGWRCKCPLHNDTEPSMWVYTDTNSFYCFGCGESGGPRWFLRKIGIAGTPRAAIDWLAANVDARRAPPRLDKLSRNTNTQGAGAPNATSLALDRLLQTGQLTARKEAAGKAGAQTAAAYLAYRGFQLEDYLRLAEMDMPAVLGAFPDRTYLPQGLSADAKKRLSDIGVLTRRGWLGKRWCPGVYFGIRDIRGPVVGMQVRSLREPADPKYLFTKSYSAWTKSRSLYLLAESLTTWGPDYPFTIVEGPLDALALVAAGRPAVAICGDRITPGQIALLKVAGITKLALWFDHDNAGWIGAEGASGLLLQAGLDARVCRYVPGCKDACAVLCEHGREMVHAIAASPWHGSKPRPPERKVTHGV